jgi:hypothetical protein
MILVTRHEHNIVFTSTSSSTLLLESYNASAFHFLLAPNKLTSFWTKKTACRPENISTV